MEGFALLEAVSVIPFAFFFLLLTWIVVDVFWSWLKGLI